MGTGKITPYKKGLFALIATAFALTGAASEMRSEAFNELTTVLDVRAMSVAQARQTHPVRLRGVVTALSGYKNSFFLQDSAAGISVDRTDAADVQVGDQVEVTGASGAGMFAPVVLASHVRVISHVSPPPARRVTYADMMGGREDSQWIEVSGVVHSAAISKLFGNDILSIDLAVSGGSMKVFLQDFSGIAAARLIDSTVRVRGVCSTGFNQKRQFVSLGMFVPDRRDIEVVQSADKDPFAAPVTPIRNVLQFGQSSHRLKVSGIVTYQIPGHSIYIQEGNDGIRIRCSSKEVVKPGQRIEAVGFPVMGEYAPVLKDGFVRVGEYAGPLVPLRIEVKRVIAQLNGFNNVPYDEQLVQLEGKVAESHIQGGQRVWILERGGEVFEAYLPLSASGEITRNIATGSVLLLTGICAVHADADHNPLSFDILLRSPNDIVVLKQSSWWTASHAGWIVALLIALLLGMSGWMAVVRRQAHLRLLTITDPLTGLYNRRGFFMLAERQRQLALRRKTSIMLFYIDLDYFKEINDSLGHREGDAALNAVSALLRECFRKTDVIARVGGDEFAISAFENPEQSQAFMEQRLAKAVRQSNAQIDRKFKLSLSVGVLACDHSLGDVPIEDLLAKADALMYDEKRGRKNVSNKCLAS